MLNEGKSMLLDIRNMISEDRYERMMKVLDQRTGYFQVILENLYDAHNISAILRTSEAFGVQHVHIIEDKNPFQISKGISMGSDQWLTLHRSNSIENTVKILKQQGIQIYYADPKESNPTLNELPLEKPFAVLMGQEKWGVSKQAINLADSGFRIPLYGFVESFNVSVAFAVIVSTLIERLRSLNLDFYYLKDEEKKEILNHWVYHNNFSKQVSNFLKSQKDY